MGIDLEAINPSRITVLASEMTPREREFLDANREEQINCYTHAWTAKEALSKVLRLGLACPFEVLELSFLKRSGPLREGRFANFGLYKFYCWEVGEFSISIVLPSATAFEGAFSILEEFFLAAVPQSVHE
jgi:phosphopantetheinyl transferase